MGRYSMMLPNGIIFDLDDTIISFDAVAIPTWISVCEYFTDGDRIKDSSQLFDAIEKTRKWFWSDKDRHKAGRLNLDRAREAIVKRALAQLSIDDENLVNLIVRKYTKKREENISFFPKAEVTLHKIKNRDIKLSLITNGESQKQRAKIDRFRLDRFFNTILIEGELGVGKPEEAVYLRALEEMKIDPQDAWSVGDNIEWDVIGPQKLGVYAIWNDYRKRGLPRGSTCIPNRIINNISELIE